MYIRILGKLFIGKVVVQYEDFEVNWPYSTVSAIHFSTGCATVNR